jgi:hypothetical protein
LIVDADADVDRSDVDECPRPPAADRRPGDPTVGNPDAPTPTTNVDSAKLPLATVDC